MRSNKKGALTADKTVVLILAIIAILGVIGLIVSLNPNFNLKLLPDFSPPQDLDEEIPITNFDQCGQMGLQTVAAVGSNFNFVQNANLYLTNGHNDLQYDKTSERWSLKLNNIEVGYRSNGEVVISSEYLDENNMFFVENLFSEKPFSVTVEDLALLDGSVWRPDGYICKENLNDFSEYKKSWPAGTDIELIDLTDDTSKVFLRDVVGYKNELDLTPYLTWDKKLESKKLKNPDKLLLSSSPGDYFYIKMNRDGKISEPVGALTKDGSIWLFLPSQYTFDAEAIIDENIVRDTRNSNFQIREKTKILWFIPFGDKITSTGWTFSEELKFDYSSWYSIGKEFSRTNIKVDYNEIKKQVN